MYRILSSERIELPRFAVLDRSGPEPPQEIKLFKISYTECSLIDARSYMYLINSYFDSLFSYSNSNREIFIFTLVYYAAVTNLDMSWCQLAFFFLHMIKECFVPVWGGWWPRDRQRGRLQQTLCGEADRRRRPQHHHLLSCLRRWRLTAAFSQGKIVQIIVNVGLVGLRSRSDGCMVWKSEERGWLYRL